MNLNKCFLTNNDCYKAGKKITPKGIMVHSTGVNNPWLARYLAPDDGKIGPNRYGNHWNQARPDGQGVCVHAFIGLTDDGNVATYQTLPWDHRGWHAGGSANDTHIGFEICEDNLEDAGYFGLVYREALELCVYLCREYDINPNNIICHSEGYIKGVASNHSDVMHWFPEYGKTMDDFRNDVARLLAGEETEDVMSRFVDVPDGKWYAQAVEYCVEHGLMAGTGNGKFEPDRPVTRAELAAVVAKVHQGQKE